MKRPNTPFRTTASLGLLLAASPLLPLSAQDSLEVTFVGDRELEVREVVKPASSPNRVDLGMEKPVIRYTPIAKSIAPETQVQSIDPFAVRMDAPLPRLYAGYAKGGFGLYTSPLAEIHYGETQSRTGSWGIHTIHHSSAGSTTTGNTDTLGLDEGWSHNALGGHYKRFLDRSSLTLAGGLERDAWGLHGLDLSQTSGFSAPNTRQTYTRMHTSARLQNHQRDSTKVQRDLRLEVSRLSIGLAPLPADAVTPDILIEPGRENLITGTGTFQAWQDDALFSLDLEGHIIGSSLDAEGDSSFASVSRNSALIGAVPTITKERGAYKIKVGAGLWVDARGRQAFHFYPTAEVRFRLLDDVFVPYGGVDGGMQRNALHDLVKENPWFDARYNAGVDALRGTLYHTNRALELYGGLRGKFTRDLAFNAQARTVTYRDFGYWVNEAGIDSAGQRFSLAFDTLTVASVIGETAYRGRGPLELEARVEFHTYGTGDQPHAWYQPRTRFSGSARLNLDGLLFLEAGMEVIGARYAPSRTPFAQVKGEGDNELQTGAEALASPMFGGTDPIYARKLPAYTALDLGIEYRYNARLALGLDASGPLGDTQIFNGYNAQRFRVMMWAGYRF
ncbi:MAG: hypothetical protein VXW79_01695 [Bacteroidota bacterium]|nr:hypothetical protein [Bacteroidota bacterium]